MNKDKKTERIGFLRQWLNEDRITDPKKMVTDEQLEMWLESQDEGSELQESSGEWEEKLIKEFMGKCGAWFDDFHPSNKKLIGEYLLEVICRERGRMIEEMVRLSDEIELGGDTSLEEWKAFKRFRNTMRDRARLKTGEEEQMDTYKATYAWVRKVAGFEKQPDYDPINTRCGWCNKSQNEILNEHIENHDSENKDK